MSDQAGNSRKLTKKEHIKCLLIQPIFHGQQHSGRFFVVLEGKNELDTPPTLEELILWLQPREDELQSLEHTLNQHLKILLRGHSFIFLFLLIEECSLEIIWGKKIG